MLEQQSIAQGDHCRISRVRDDAIQQRDDSAVDELAREWDEVCRTCVFG
jgi:hypothetical protein